MTVLVERYHERVFQFVYRKMGGHHVAEDVTQECFVRLCSRAERYQYPRPFRPLNLHHCPQPLPQLLL